MDLHCPFDLQNADMTDNAKKERNQGHVNSADKQDDKNPEIHIIIRSNIRDT